jgi:hypothetical protein
MRIVQNEGARDGLDKLDQPGGRPALRARPARGGLDKLDQPAVGSMDRVGR